ARTVSGALADGSGGAAAVAAAGGTVLVQDPNDAIVPSMPESALHAVGEQATVIAGNAIGDALARLADERSALREGVVMVPDPPPLHVVPRRAPTALPRPECGGALWDDEQGGIIGYRCRVGHAYSEDALIGAQATGVEAALWTAVEVLEERAELLRRVAVRRGGGGDLRDLLEE